MAKQGSFTSAIGLGIRIIGIPILGFALLLFAASTSSDVLEYTTKGQKSIMDDISVVDPQYEGKLVYATGLAKAESPARDTIIGAVKDAIAIRKDVHYYQWCKVKEYVGSRTSSAKHRHGRKVTRYRDVKTWTSNLDKKTFGNDVPEEKRNYVLLEVNTTDVSSKVSFGAYELNDEQKKKIGEICYNEIQNAAVDYVYGNKRLEIDIDRSGWPELNKKIAEIKRAKGEFVDDRSVWVHRGGDTVLVYTDPAKPLVSNGNDSLTISPDGAKVVAYKGKDCCIYIGRDPTVPEIGDVKIIYTYSEPEMMISTLAGVRGNSFYAYPIKWSNMLEVERFNERNSLKSVAQDHDNSFCWSMATLVLLGVCLVLLPSWNTRPLWISLWSTTIEKLIGCVLVTTIQCCSISALTWYETRNDLTLIHALVAIASAWFVWKKRDKKAPSSD